MSKGLKWVSNIMRNSGNYCEDSLFAFFFEQYTSLFLSLHVRHSSENRSEIRETLNFIDFLRVVGICAVVYEDMLEGERERERVKERAKQ